MVPEPWGQGRFGHERQGKYTRIVLWITTFGEKKTAQALHYAIQIYQCTGCSGKNVFFHNSLQPLPRLHRCKRPSKLSTQCKCTVTPIGWEFFFRPIAAEFCQERGGKISRILGKIHNI